MIKTVGRLKNIGSVGIPEHPFLPNVIVAPYVGPQCHLGVWWGSNHLMLEYSRLTAGFYLFQLVVHVTELMYIILYVHIPLPPLSPTHPLHDVSTLCTECGSLHSQTKVTPILVPSSQNNPYCRDFQTKVTLFWRNLSM